MGTGLAFKGLGFEGRLRGLSLLGLKRHGIRVERVWTLLSFRVLGLGFRVLGLGFRV